MRLKPADRLQNSIHGANPEKLFQAFKLNIPERIINFATNTNILKPANFPEIDVQALAANYPDPDCSELREIISQSENIPTENILFTNGINEAIFLLAKILGNNTAILQPNYPEYRRAFQDAHDIYSIYESGAYSNVIISNPNNPTGEFHASLYDFAHRKFPDVKFIIDESYIYFLSEIPQVQRAKNIILLRSLTKIFPLSGARIGYVIANPEIIAAMKNSQPYWSVNAIAQELAKKFLLDEDFLIHTREFYAKAAPEFRNSLQKLGFELSDSHTHFFILRLPDNHDDMQIIQELLKLGLIVRHTRNFEGLYADEKYFRIATRFPDENILLCDALRKLVL